ncbi:MAG: hypothetical protein COW42_14850 [Deltaproteobacteria bacterium CG17_big_fil_post_rev_8_21_14_2_50_63_7]|nr:MAG: hypothetical protein COW42_14850 [Deltaproteobacteria bacterium CG17_big_fil_post_rev_8_21_14_2_50_63_7]
MIARIPVPVGPSLRRIEVFELCQNGIEGAEQGLIGVARALAAERLPHATERPVEASRCELQASQFPEHVVALLYQQLGADSPRIPNHWGRANERVATLGRGAWAGGQSNGLLRQQAIALDALDSHAPFLAVLLGQQGLQGIGDGKGFFERLHPPSAQEVRRGVVAKGRQVGRRPLELWHGVGDCLGRRFAAARQDGERQPQGRAEQGRFAEKIGCHRPALEALWPKAGWLAAERGSFSVTDRRSSNRALRSDPKGDEHRDSRRCRKEQSVSLDHDDTQRA